MFRIAAAPNTTDALGAPSLAMPRLLAAYDYNGDNVLPNDAIQTAIGAVLAEAIAGLPSPPPPPDQPPSPPTPPPAAPGQQAPSSITTPPAPTVPSSSGVTNGTTPWAPWAPPDSPPAPGNPRGVAAAAGGSAKGSSQLVVILAVVLGAVVALGFLAVLYVMLKRRRRQQEEEEEESEDSKEAGEEVASGEEKKEGEEEKGVEDEEGSSELCGEPHTRTHSHSSIQRSDASTVARSSQSGTQPRDPRRSPASRLLRTLSGKSNAVAPEPPALVSPTASITEGPAAAGAADAVTVPAAAAAASPRSPGGSGSEATSGAATPERRFSGRRATSSFRALDVPPELDPIPESQEVDVQGPVPPRLASPPAARRAQAAGPTDADQQEAAAEGEQAPTVQVAPAGALKDGRANGSKKPSFVVRQVAPEPLPLGAQEAGAGVAVGFAPLSKSKGKGAGGEQQQDAWSASKRWGWKSSRSMSGKVHAADGSESGGGEDGEDDGQEGGYGSGGRDGERSSGASRSSRHKGRKALDDDNVSSPRGGEGSSANASLQSRGGGGGRTSPGGAASPAPSNRTDSGSGGRGTAESSGGRRRPWSGGSGSRVVPEDAAEHGGGGRMSGSGRSGAVSRPWSGGSRGQVVPVNAEVVGGRKGIVEDGGEPVGSGARARPWSGGSGSRVAPEPDDSRVTRIHIREGDSPGGFMWASSRTGGSKKQLRATTSQRSRGSEDLGALPGVVCIEDELEEPEDSSEGVPPHADKYDRASAPAGSSTGLAGAGGTSSLVMGMKPGMGMRFISLPKLGANLPLPPLPEPGEGARGMSRTTSLGASGWMKPEAATPFTTTGAGARGVSRTTSLGASGWVKPEAAAAPLATTISGGQTQLPPFPSRLQDSTPQGASTDPGSSQQQPQQQPSPQALAGSTWAATRSTSMKLLGSGSGLLGGSWGALGSPTGPATDLPAPGPVLRYATSMGPAFGRQQSSGFGAVGGGGNGGRLGSPPERLMLGSPPGAEGTGMGGPRAPAPTKSWRLRLGSDGGGGSDA